MQTSGSPLAARQPMPMTVASAASATFFAIDEPPTDEPPDGTPSKPVGGAAQQGVTKEAVCVSLTSIFSASNSSAQPKEPPCN